MTKSIPVTGTATLEDLAAQAVLVHSITHGAPVEISCGGRKVKIGGWLTPDQQGAVERALDVAVDVGKAYIASRS